MNITLKNIGKRYQHEWVFQNISISFSAGECIAIHGANGSGKSTFVKLLSGYLTPSSGEINWSHPAGTIPIDILYRHIALSAPYLSLYDDFTLWENIQFFRRFKSFRNGITDEDIIHLTELRKAKDKPLRYYSSGMKQRVKLALAILSHTPLLFLDEPCSHLDEQAVSWYQELLRPNMSDRIIFIASNNHRDETFLCNQIMAIETYK